MSVSSLPFSTSNTYLKAVRRIQRRAAWGSFIMAVLIAVIYSIMMEESYRYVEVFLLAIVNFGACLIFHYTGKRQWEFITSVYGLIPLIFYVQLAYPEIKLEFLFAIGAVIKILIYKHDRERITVPYALLISVVIYMIVVQYVIPFPPFVPRENQEFTEAFVAIFGAVSLVQVSYWVYHVGEQERMELRRSLVQYQSFYLKSSDGLLSADYESGKVIAANNSLLHMLGGETLCENLTVNAIFQDVTNAQDLEEMWNSRSDPNASLQVHCERRDGRSFQAQVIGFYRSDDGVVSLGVRDVEKEIRYMQELERGERRFRSLVDSIPSGILALDSSGQVVFNSATARSILGYHGDEPVGLNWHDIVAETDRANTDLALVDNHPRGVINYYTRFMLSDGESIDVMCRVTRIADVAIQGEYLAVFTDITSETATQKELARTASYLQGLLAATPSEILILNADYQVQLYNEASRERYLRMYGVVLDLDKRLSHKRYDRIPSDYKQNFIESQKRGAYQVELDDEDKQGRPARYQAVYLTIRNAFEIIGYLEIRRDITELLKRERELESSRTSYKSIFQNSSDGIIILDSDCKTVMDANERARELLKLSSDKVLIGSDLTEYLDIDSTSSSSNALDTSYPGTFGQLQHYQTPSGEYFWYELKLIETEIDDKKNYICFLVDVDRRYRLLSENIEKNQLLENFMSISRLGIDIIEILEVTGNGPRGVVQYRNDNMRRYLKSRGASKLFGQGDLLFDFEAEPSDLSMEYQNIALELDEDGFSEAELQMEIDGEQLIFRCRLQLITLRDKVIFIRVLEDVSERVHQEREIKRQMALLDQTNVTLEKYIESNLQLENFAYIASHDLRAPLRAIMSFSNLLDEKYRSGMDAKAQTYLDIIKRSSINMLAFIDDLLLFSRVNTQDLQIESFEAYSLQSVLHEEFDHAIVDKRGSLQFHGWNEVLLGDKTKLKIVLQNLISNAIKFCKVDVPPEIHCKLERTGSAYVITVSDNGIGFEEKYREKIFQIFEKLHSHDKYEGTGLGLAISSKIVKKHKGSITVSSVPDAGTTFTITIDEKLLNTSPASA